MVKIKTLRVGCGYVYVSWKIVNSNICRIRYAIAEFKNDRQRYRYSYGTPEYYVNFTRAPSDTVLNLTVYVTNTDTISVQGYPSSPTVLRTMYMQCTYR